MGKSMRCQYDECRKKITPVQEIVGLCKCGQIYCITHRDPSCHKCTFDFKSEINKDNFIKNNKCIAQKVLQIG